MQEDNWLCLRRRKFVVMTTDSKHNLRVFTVSEASNAAAQVTN
jgi:hypothetical protein